MRAHSKIFTITARSLALLIAVPLLGFVWGCDGSSSSPSDEEKTKIQDMEKKIKEIHAKKRPE